MLMSAKYFSEILLQQVFFQFLPKVGFQEINNPRDK